jgi:ABC-2 type transport system permease protein
LGKKVASAPRIASGLIACWVLLAFVIPILSDLFINHSVHSPKGGDILLVQREAVNDAWDLPVSSTMAEFGKTHPEYAAYEHNGEGFDWAWYYAFQQVGDQAAEDLSDDYRAAAKAKREYAAYATFLSPPLLLQRKMTRLANTDAFAAFEYERQIRDFHEQLRLTYYPWLFGQERFDKSKLNLLPHFNKLKNHKKRVQHEQE